MRFFLDTRKTASNGEMGSLVTNSYIELEFPVDPDNSFVVYIIPRSESSAFVATCWDHLFDDLVGDLDEDKLEIISDAWPTLLVLLHNGINDLYQQGALIVLEDLDYGEKKWFVGSIAGNISFESPEEIFGGERMQEAMNTVFTRTLQLFTELNERQPNWLKQAGKGILKGVGLGLLAGVAAFFDDSI